MKKTQILSAIALAFALGVVAPIAVAENASATVVAGQSNQKYVNGEITAIKNKFGTVQIYDVNNGMTTSYVNGYDRYSIVDGRISVAQGVVDAGKTAAAGSLQANAGSVLYSVKTGAEGQIIKQATWDALMANNDWNTHTDFNKVLALVNGVKNELQVVKDNRANTYTTAEALAAGNAIDALNNYIAQANQSIDTYIVANGTAAISDIVYTVKELANETITTPATVAELNAAIAKIEAKLPQMAAYRRASAAIAKFQGAPLNGSVSGLTDRQVKEIVDALWAAYNGTTPDKTVDQIVDEVKPGVNAPATGVVGTAEGTATTVSIVAGLATALTALGAGVVAYRSARRK